MKHNFLIERSIIMSDYYEQSQDSTVKRDNEDDARLMSMLIFLLGFFTSVIGPIIIWAIKRNESRLVDKAGKNYFNMLISYLIWNFVVGICMVPVFFIYVVNNEAAYHYRYNITICSFITINCTFYPICSFSYRCMR